MYIWQVAYYQFFFIPLKILQYAKSTEILNTGSRGWGWGVLRSFGGGEGREGVWVQTLLENSNLLNLHSKVTENRHWHFLGKRNYLSDPPWKNFSLSVHGLHWLWPRELPCHLANEVRLALWLFTQISSNMKDDSFSLIFKEYIKFWKSYALNYRRSKIKAIVQLCETSF